MWCVGATCGDGREWSGGLGYVRGRGYPAGVVVFRQCGYEMRGREVL